MIFNQIITKIEQLVDPVLENNSWEFIKLLSSAGVANLVFSVGDTKTIKLNGTCGLVNFDNFEVQCYIIGFNHNADKEGKNLIHFQIGKVNGEPISFTEGQFGGYLKGVVTGYSMQSDGTNTGGWAGSHMRNDIIGNGNINNNQYIFNKKPSSDELSETTLLDVQFICNGIEYTTISTKRGSLVFMTKAGSSITVYNGSVWSKPEYRYITVLDGTDLSSDVGVKNSITKIQSKCVDNLHYTFNNSKIIGTWSSSSININFTSNGEDFTSMTFLKGELYYNNSNGSTLAYNGSVAGQYVWVEKYRSVIFNVDPIKDTPDFDSWLITNSIRTPLIFTSCLPDDLKQNMSYALKYTDNVGDDNCVENAVFATVDYLSLLSEYEVFGTYAHANEFEQNYMQRYAYYANGGATIKHRHSRMTQVSCDWLRSPTEVDPGYCCINRTGEADWEAPEASYGISPVFFI